jgi:GDP-4-dehydro-6-deoxy-D-mannose reductase
MIMARRNLITGITGFAGRYLARNLIARGEQVWGVARREAAGVPAEAVVVPGDAADPEFLRQILHRIGPTHVYHLAGYTHAGRSFKEPQAAWHGNLTMTLHLLEALQQQVPQARLLWVGSGLVYGQPTHPNRPVDEETALRPDTPYAVSKAAADLAAFAAWRASGLDVVRARPFNHTGPEQATDFAIPSFARQLVAIERGESPPVLEVGDLQSYRDISDVRDVVEAYRLLMDHGQAGEAYNVASGVSRSMRAILDELVSQTGLSIEVRTRADLLRPSEQTIIQVDTHKIRGQIGWSPQYALQQTLADTLDAWRRAGVCE